MYHPIRFTLVVTVLAVVTGTFSTTIMAQLTPEQVAVVAAAGNEKSEELARYYISQRNIPANQLILVNVSSEDTISRAEWNDNVVVPIRQWLAENDPEFKLKCLVTVRGVPIYVDGIPEGTPDAYREFLLKERANRTSKIREYINEIRKIGVFGDLEPVDVSGDNAKSRMDWAGDFETAVKEAQERIRKLESTVSRNDASRALENSVTILGGSSLIMNTLNQQTSGGTENSQASRNFHFLRGRVASFQEAVTLASQLPPNDELDTLTMSFIERAAGLIGTIEWIDSNLASIDQGETGAALDSELAIIRWTDRNYRLNRWQPNFLRSSLEGLSINTRYPTLQVARIDAKTWETCRKMIDVPIEVEKNGGLKGVAYFDMRGLQDQPGMGVEKQFDLSMALAATQIDKSGKMRVVSNNDPALFEAGQCPDAALYCGSYSLAKYVDAFDWAPGAIGYHISSFEASDLHAEGNTAWCQQMLEDGAVATLGGVAECGIGTLPRPAPFFDELVSQGATLGDAFWHHTSFTSWNVILLGDPLYRPFPKSNGN